MRGEISESDDKGSRSEISEQESDQEPVTLNSEDGSEGTKVEEGKEQTKRGPDTMDLVDDSSETINVEE